MIICYQMNRVMVSDSSIPGREERQAVIDRVLNSHAFESSERLRALLVYLAKRSQSDPLVREQEIGVAVFGRPEGYDTSHDTLVRVQISNLRKKLQQYFEEGSYNETWGVHIPKGNYALLFRPLNPEARELLLPSRPESIASPQPPDPTPAPPLRQKREFWSGLAIGAAISLTITAGVTGMYLAKPVANPHGMAPAIASHPMWAPFRASTVTLAISTPLFFFSENGFERDFRLNYPQDLADAPQRLLRQPASPEWDRWAPFDDVISAARLQESLAGLGSHTTVRSAREVSLSDISGRKTIVLGHPRGAPFLLDAMSDLNFRPPLRTSLPQRGFINVAPLAGESAAYGSSESTPMERSSEGSPDYALVTSLRIAPDGELLSLFGNRAQTSLLVLQKILDPAFVEHLNEKVFRSAGRNYKSCQIVLRVDYSKGNPIGAVYLTHRIKR
jgi:hypothetical protein